MKKYIKLLTVLSLGLLISNACTDDFDKMNTSKSLITEDLINVDMMFTRVLGYTIIESQETGFGTNGNWSGMSTSGANRPFDLGPSDGIWNKNYGNAARSLSDIIHICSTRENAADLVNKKAIARILRVWAFADITDTYGDIPYFESCLPVDQAVTTPKYDSQKDIYIDFFKELKEAVAEMDAEKAKYGYGNADILYKGNLTKWKKFANSLRLRLAIRVHYADPVLAKEQMADLTEADLITARADDASIYNITDYPNHESDRFTDLRSRKSTVKQANIAKTFHDILLNKGDKTDPRLYVYADSATAVFPDLIPPRNFGFRARPLLSGESPEEGNAYSNYTTSTWSTLLYVQIQEFPLYKASETYFNLAEAALFNLKSGDAQAYYKKGIELAMAHAKELYDKAVPQLDPVVGYFLDGKTQTEKDARLAQVKAGNKITQSDIDDFLATAATVALTGTDEKKQEQIINQKLIALFPLELQGWCDHRRTGYPRILVGEENSILKGRMPRRFPWPANEQLINKTQYQIALDHYKTLERIGGTEEDADGRLTKFWWQAKPGVENIVHPGTVETQTKQWDEQ